MSKIADAEANATSLDGLVNDNGLITTLRNGPKPSWQYIVDQVYAQLGYAVVGSFVDGFTYTGIRQVGVDASGNTWIYTGGEQNLPHVVPAGTVPSAPDYFQVSVNSADNVVLDNGENLQQAIDRLNMEVDEVTKNRQAIEAVYKAQGYNNVFFFEDGFTYAEDNDIGVYLDGTAWTYANTDALPVTIAAGTVPSEGVYSRAYREYPLYLSLSKAEHSNLKVGDYVRLTDYACGLYEVVGGGDTGGYYAGSLDNGNKLKLYTGGSVEFSSLVATSESEIASALSSSLSTIINFDFNNATNPVRAFSISNTPDYKNFRINGAKLYTENMYGKMANVPEGFKIRPLFSALSVGAGKVEADFDIREFDIALTSPASNVKTYYVDPINGTSGGTGAENDPLDSLARVGLKELGEPSAEPVLEIIAKPHKYDQSNALSAGSAGIKKSYSLRRWGEVGKIKQLQGRWGDSQTWSNLGGGVWSTSLGNCASIFDESITNDLGDPSFYNKVNSDVDNTAGTWFQDGGTIKIHTLDGREPDSNIGIGRLIANYLIDSSVTTADIYCEDVEFLGGLKAMQLSVAPSTSNIRWFNNRCKFMYGQTNGQEAEGHTLVINENCVGAYNGSDGFNYHSNTSDLSSESVCIEINCRGYRNGYSWSSTQNINNGSTGHDECIIMRYGTVAFENQGPNIVDVNNSYSYNFACHAQDSLRAKPHPDSADFDFASAGATVGVFAWMQCCTTSFGGSTYSLTSNSESVKLRDCNIHPSVHGVPSISYY